MPARSIAVATIQFRSLSIPVRLFTTVSKSKAPDLKLTSMHASCMGRTVQRHVCTVCTAVLEQAETIRCFEHQPGKYRHVTDEDIKELDALTSNIISLDQFVVPASLEPLFVDKCFYVAADYDGEKAFAVFLLTLRNEGLVAVGTYSANKRTAIVTLRAHHDVLLLQQLRPTDETLSWTEVPLPGRPAVSAEDLAAARDLVRQSRTDTVELTRYRDDVPDRAVNLLRSKSASQIVPPVGPMNDDGLVQRAT